MRRNVQSTNYWLSVVKRPGSANKDPSFMRTSDIFTHAFILILTMNDIMMSTDRKIMELRAYLSRGRES